MSFAVQWNVSGAKQKIDNFAKKQHFINIKISVLNLKVIMTLILKTVT